MGKTMMELVDLKIEDFELQSQQCVQIMMVRKRHRIIECRHQQIQGMLCPLIDIRHFLHVHHINVPKVGGWLVVEDIEEEILTEEQQPPFCACRDIRDDRSILIDDLSQLLLADGEVGPMDIHRQSPLGHNDERMVTDRQFHTFCPQFIRKMTQSDTWSRQVWKLVRTEEILNIHVAVQ